MTRELNFRQTFSSQFETATAFTRISIPDIQKLAPSDFPGFALALGDAKYTGFDALGFPTEGEQNFILTLFMSVPERSPELLLQYRSDYLSVVELFLASGYIPPPVQPGENYRIVQSQLVKTDAPILSKTTTRFSISIQCKYLFTML